MPHVITGACIDIKDGACVKCCPVDCIYEGARTLYIHPDECIDCGICVSACPTQAIYEDLRLPPEMAHFAAINRDFFAAGPVACDHPGIAKEGARLAG